MTPLAELNLRTARLHLRPLAAGDEADLFAIFGDPQVMRYWSTPPWQGLDDAVAAIERDRRTLAGRQDLRLGVVLHAGEAAGRLVGTVSLFRIDASNRRAEIGYALARSQQGSGLMHEALQALVATAFDHTPGAPFDDLALHRLEADADPRNAASCRTLQRLGFLREGLLRERWQVGGELSDSAWYGLLRPDWLASRASAAQPAG
ncbi:GNAT family N-acetyltransferase [Ideonella sp.]|uniref:GNAT family N-acetyltransferase n=1 Tax=Ideonella sp. TaxID=1929293 RepID=UPI0035AFEECC